MSLAASIRIPHIRESFPMPWLTRLENLLASRWLPWMANLAMFLILCAGIAWGGWRLWVLWFEMRAPEAVLPVEAVGGRFDINSLMASNIFGQASSPGVRRELPLDAIPVTSLNLVLSGVILRGEGSYALLAINGQPETPIGMGEEILPATVLQAVYPDRILISRSGVIESVLLKDTSPSTPGASRTTPVAAIPSAGTGLPTSNPYATATANTYNVPRDQVAKQINNPDVLRQALMVPNPGGGFQVRDIQPGSVYEKLGLRVGDVVRTVNGQQINRTEDVMKLYQQHKGSAAGQITVDISRGGKPEQLRFNLQ
jgi:general secretion pathway protein C